MAIALQARYVFTGAGPPLADGILTIEKDRILAVGENRSGRAACQLGNVALVPAPVNAHTHLEFSHLEAPLGTPGLPFPAWIRGVVQERRGRPDPAECGMRAVECGLAEVAATGTGGVGEIASPAWSEAPFTNSQLAGVVFLELLGQSPAQKAELLAAARGHGERALWAGRNWQPGLSPHAPYTVSPELVQGAVALAAEHGWPVAMHLAESWSELELLASGSGPLVDMLQEFEAWNPAAVPRGIRSLDYLEWLSRAPRALVVHGNYLASDDLGFLAANRQHMSVVYCPRTHARFGHARYPLGEMLAAGVTVCLGTDSRASNPDLAVWREMRFLAERQVVPSSSIFHLGTLAGARALGLEHACGTLAPGRPARLARVPLPEDDAADPYDLLWHHDLEPIEPLELAVEE